MPIPSRPTRIASAVAACLLLVAASGAQARVTKITIQSTTSPIFNGQAFGTVGAYEQVKGTATGEIDPADRRNAVITDIQFAPRNANGKVEYTTTFTIVKPVDMTKASGVMVFEVANRGNHLVPGTLSVGADPGDGFLYKPGHVYLWSGWQGDQPIGSVTAAQEAINVPIAKNADGTSITGPVFARFPSVAQVSGVNQTTVSLPAQTVIDGQIYGRAPASLDTTKATLITATAETQSGTRTGERTVPSADWAFADCRTTSFPGTPDATRLCVKGGFDPALLYQLVYTAKDPLVLGVGFAAMRDVNSFFRSAARDDAGTANPVAGRISKVIGYGISQSGRFQKTFLNLGFNEDESGKIVWDGVDTDIAGMMGQFNIRFAIPGNIANLYEPGAEGPLWWADYTDTVRGRPTWGILHRCTATATCPKIFETYGGPEYWYSRGTPGIAGTKGTEDLPVPDNVRRYYMSGTTHGGGAGGWNLTTPVPNGQVMMGNPNPEKETLRALFVRLVDWVSKGTSPPASVYPRVTDGTLVAATSAAMGWPNIPNAPKPDGVMNSVLDYDWGAGFNYNDVSGVMTNVVPPVRQVVPTLAPKVNSDGNEIAGIPTVLSSMPLGTYVGWNPVASGILKGQEASLAGGWIPFAKTKAERVANGDPRPSLEERYGNLWGYYFGELQAANALVAQGFLLPDDANRLINQMLNDMLKNALLPKRGEFMPGFAPKPLELGADVPPVQLVEPMAH